MVEALGYAAFGMNVAGNLMLARMNVWGWIVRLVTNVAWIGYAVQIPGGAPMWLNHAAFFAINVYGFRAWQQNASAEPPPQPTRPRPERRWLYQAPGTYIEVCDVVRASGYTGKAYDGHALIEHLRRLAAQQKGLDHG